MGSPTKPPHSPVPSFSTQSLGVGQSLACWQLLEPSSFKQKISVFGNRPSAGHSSSTNLPICSVVVVVVVVVVVGCSVVVGSSALTGGYTEYTPRLIHFGTNTLASARKIKVGRSIAEAAC